MDSLLVTPEITEITDPAAVVIPSRKAHPRFMSMAYCFCYDFTHSSSFYLAPNSFVLPGKLNWANDLIVCFTQSIFSDTASSVQLCLVHERN